MCLLPRVFLPQPVLYLHPSLQVFPALADLSPTSAYSNLSTSFTNHQLPPPLPDVFNSHLHQHLDSHTSIIEIIMALNSLAPQFNLQSILSYNDWVARNTFNPFSPKPIIPISHANPGTRLHFRTRGEFRLEGGMNVDGRFDHGYGSSKADVTHNFSQEVSPDPPSDERKLITLGLYHRDPDSSSRKSGSNVPPA